MEFRMARSGDYEEVAALNKQVYEFHADARPDLHRKVEGQFTREAYEGWLQDKDMDVVVMVEDDEEGILGYAALEWQVAPIKPVLQPRKTVYVRDLVVDEGQRGRGLGALLMEQVADYARERGADAVELNVFECNPSALRFYEREGYRTKTRMMELILDKKTR